MQFALRDASDDRDIQLLNPNTMQRFDADRLARCSYFSNITGVSADWTRHHSLLPLSCRHHFEYPRLGTFVFYQSAAESTNASTWRSSRTGVPMARVKV